VLTEELFIVGKYISTLYDLKTKMLIKTIVVNSIYPFIFCSEFAMVVVFNGVE